jgi:DNA-binding transcriptional regulator YiaG
MNEVTKTRRAEKVLRWLKRENLSQASWARKLGVSHMTVFFWIHNGVVPHEIYLDRIRERTPKCPLVQGK